MKKEKGRVTEIDKIIGNKIKKLREDIGVTSKYLAELIGVSHQQFTKYENSSNRISIGRLLLLCKKLSVDANYFFDEFGVSPNNNPAFTFGMDFMKLKNPKHQEAVNILVRALI